MQVQVLYFQQLRRLTGRDSERVTLAEPATLADLTAAINAAHPPLAALARSLLFAVNQEHAAPATPLAEGDTVAVMPPFSGG